MALTLPILPAGVMMKNPNYRRAIPEYSQQIRRAFQVGFLALNVWICIGFYRWVWFYETGGNGSVPTRPPGVEGWLPIASLMNLKVFLLTGALPGIHPAGLFLLLSFIAMCWLLRKSFCSWLCPVGTISEYLWTYGKKTFRRNWRIPRWGDIALRSLKYILLGLFLYAVASMSVGGIKAFLEGPYGVVSDVKMLNFFRYMGLAGMIGWWSCFWDRCSSRTSGAATCALTALCSACCQRSARSRSSARFRSASTAKSAPRRARRVWRSTS